MTDPLLAARALLLHDLAARETTAADVVALVEDVVSQRRWWVESWPGGAEVVAGQLAQDLQERLLDDAGQRWPGCPLHEGTHELRIDPDLGPDPHWVCEDAGAVVAPLGGLSTRPEAGDTGDAEREVGVGPHPLPWPDDPRLDPELLAHGDRRNVVDRYRYWTVEAVVADLDSRRHAYHVAVENWQHDLNIGTVVRTANAFLAAEVHIVGNRRWNRRGAMVTDRYQHVRHHPTVEDLVAWAREEGLPLVGVDNLPGSVALETYPLPERCVLVLGQEGPGLSDAMAAACDAVCSIAMYGSTRSVNASVAAAVAMHTWVRRWALGLPS